MIVPETLRGLLKQRARWTQGGVEAILKHKKEIFIRSHLRFVPVMIEQLASGLWAYMLLFSVLIQAITMIIGQHYSFPIGTWGAWLAIMCMIQLFQAARIDSNYEPNMMRYLFYGIWYPLGYWIFNSMMVYVGFPKAFFRRKKKYASWVSPDRGEAPATGAPLDPQNRWVKPSGMIPWDLIEEKYSLTFYNPIKGKPAKSCPSSLLSITLYNLLRVFVRTFDI